MTSPRRALVTGGAGFVGSHLTDVFVSEGWDVTVVDDLSRGARERLPEGVELREIDIRDVDLLTSAVSDANPDVIVHLAALHFIPEVDNAPELAHSINVDGTANVCAVANAAGTETLLFASTAAVYPNLPTPLGENVEPGPIDLYGRTKLAGEALVRGLAESSHSTTVAARLFNVIGPRETNPHVLPEIVNQLRAGATTLELGNLEPRRDFVDVRDVADALFRLAAIRGRGLSIYNVGTGHAVSVLELVQECERILGTTITIRQAPERMREVERMTLVAERSAIERAVGWKPERTLRETLEDLLDDR